MKSRSTPLTSAVVERAIAEQKKSNDLIERAANLKQAANRLIDQMILARHDREQRTAGNQQGSE